MPFIWSRVWENNGWGLVGNGFYFFTKFGKITVVEMASQKLVESSRLVQSLHKIWQNHSGGNGFPEIGGKLQASAKC